MEGIYFQEAVQVQEQRYQPSFTFKPKKQEKSRTITPVHYHNTEKLKEQPRQKPKISDKSSKKQVKGYPMIPLIYDDLAVHRQCRDKQVIYRGLYPKRSQIYFKTLIDIDWQNMKYHKSEFIRQITFDSRFESGNLQYVVKVSDRQYNLYIRVDTNTAGHKMWYYFRISNRKPCRIKINICRFPKYKSLYNRGLKPFIFSKKHFLTTGVKWQQQGQNVNYYQDDNIMLQKPGYILSFQYQIKYQYDEIFIATLPPYTYTKMTKFISGLPVAIGTLCKSLGGLNIPYITIPSLPTSKMFVVVSARIHPGQSPSSYVCQGLIQQLLKPSSAYLLQNVTFIIIPMINPDGVFVGNYRTGLLGLDLNRQFNTIDQEFMPQVTGLKNLIQKLQIQGKVDFFLDLHGHSTRRDMFAFCPQWQNSLRFYKSKLLIKKISQISPSFDIDRCTYKNCKQKQYTARIFLYSRHKIKSITFQTTFGLIKNQQKSLPVGPPHWISFGTDIVDGLKDYYIQTKDTCKQGNQLLSHIKQLYFARDGGPKKQATKQQPSQKILQILSNGRIKTQQISNIKKKKKQQIDFEKFDSAQQSSNNDSQSENQDLSNQKLQGIKHQIAKYNKFKITKKPQPIQSKSKQKNKLKIISQTRAANVYVYNIQEQLPDLSSGIFSNKRYHQLHSKTPFKSRRKPHSSQIQLLPSLLSKKNFSTRIKQKY